MNENTSLDFYTLYRTSMQRVLTPDEAEQLQHWQKEYPYFALPQMAQARGQAGTDEFFRAAIYAPDRRQLQQYVRGRLYWPNLSSAPESNMSDSSPSPQNSESIPGGFKHIAPSFVAFDIEATHLHAKAQDLHFGIGVKRQVKQPYFHQLLMEKSLLFRGLFDQIRGQLQTFPNSDRLEVAPTSQWPSSYFPSSIPQRKKRKANLIDQFLAEKPQMKRPDPLAEGQSLDALNQQIERSTSPDQNLVTETLAQLFLRQGNAEEAIRIYEQLRLRFPHKSTYFDAQIKKISHS